MILNNKFEIGQEVYTTYRKPIEYDCVVCKGEGKFAYNGYEVKCPHCYGTGKLTDKKTLSSPVPHPLKIKGIKASIGKKVVMTDGMYIATDELNQSIKYTFEHSWVDKDRVHIKSRPQEYMFETMEEAERSAYEQNRPIPKEGVLA